MVIGTDVAKDFFPGVDPIGKELKIEGYPFRVIGVLEKQGSVFGMNMDLQAFAPFDSPMSQFTHAWRNLYGVVVQAPAAEEMGEVRDAVQEVMRRRHHLKPEQDDDFVLETSASALSTWDTIKHYLVLAGIALPAIGLVVGAIVIMNIMLVAVAERTREIGIRKSSGCAAQRHPVAVPGGVGDAEYAGRCVGVGFGIGLSHLIHALTPLPTTVAPWSIVVSIALGAGVGIISGAYPAVRASKLDPITALRAE